MKKGDSLILPISKTTQNFNQIFKIMHVHTCRLEITEILIMLERETELQVFFSWHSSYTQQLTHSPAFFIFIASRRHAEAIFDSLYLINSYSIKDISRIYLAIVSVSMDALAHCQNTVFKLSFKKSNILPIEFKRQQLIHFQIDQLKETI